jgi:hypothetical protein
MQMRKMNQMSYTGLPGVTMGQEEQNVRILLPA